MENVSFSKTPSKLVKIYPSYSESAPRLKLQLQKPETILKLCNAFNPKKSFNENYAAFDNILHELMNSYFQAKIVKYNKYRHKKSKWITKGILKSIFYRDKLYVKLKSISTNNQEYITSHERFKAYNTILKRAIREAKRLYYHGRFQKFKSDIKNKWTTINEILNKHKNKTSFPNYFLKEGREIPDPQKISNEFNSYYVNVGPQLIKKCNDSIRQNFPGLFA